MEKIGGGRQETVAVRVDGKEQKLMTRMNLWGTDLGVVIEEKSPYEGCIVVPHWEEAIKILIRLGFPARRIERWQPEWLQRFLVPSLYDAYRQTLHILHQYGERINLGESGLMLRAQREARGLNTAILGLRKENVEQYQRDIRKRVASLNLAIGQVRELFKSEAKGYLARLEGLTDSSGKVSETVKMAEATALFARLKARQDGILRISPIVASRCCALKTALEIIQYYLRSAEDFLQRALTLGEKAVALDLQRQKLISRLNFLADDLGTIDVNPFRLNCGWCADELRTAVSHFQRKNDQSGWKLLSICRFSLKIKRAQQDLEKLILQLTHLLLRLEARPGLVKANIFSPLQFQVQRILEGIEKISEEGFCKPVLATVGNLLGESHGLLEKRNSLLLPQVKDLLKASSCLM